MLYVLHCSDASLWDRRGSPLPPTIEIRPSQVLGTGSPVDDLFTASNETIERRLKMGYEDALRSIQNLTEEWERTERAVRAKSLLRASLDDLADT